mgnify:CR=1 FL=1
MIKEIFKHSIIYGLGGMLKRATGFLLLPLYTSYLTVSQYGELEVFIVSTTIIFRVVQLGFGSALFKYFSYDTDSEQDSVYNQLVISSGFYFLLVFSAIALVILFSFRENLSLLLFDTTDYADLFSLVIVIVLFQTVHVIPRAYLRIQNRSALYSSINIGEFLVQVGITIYLVAAKGMGIRGVLLAQVITTGLAAVVFTGIIFRKLLFRISGRVIQEMLGYGIYLIPVSIGSLVLMMSSRYFILFYHNSNELGIFTLGDKISKILFMGVSAFQLAWPAIMFRIKDLPDAKDRYAEVITYYVMVFAGIFVMLCTFSRELVLILGNEEYLGALFVIPVLVGAYMIYGFFYSGTIGINIYKKTYYQTIAMILAALVNLGLNFLLTPAYGIIGTALAFLGASITLSATAVTFSQRIYRVPVEWRRIGLLVVGATGVVSIYYLALQSLDIVHILLKILLILLVLPLFLYITGFFTRSEKAFILRRLHLLRNGLKS